METILDIFTNLGSHAALLWHGARILVVEDNFLLAEMVSDCLRDWGLTVVGPACRLQEACQFARERALDGALLDVKLGESFCFPVCTILRMRKVPFAFMTGYGDRSIIPPEFRSAPVVWKPFHEGELRAAVALAIHGYEEPVEPQAPGNHRLDGDSG
jgi:DNA-binding response OmpR family regulator